MPAAPFNPTITLTMSLDVYHAMQGILAKRPFEEIVDVIMGFRNEVIPQVEKARREYDAANQPAAPQSAPPKLHLASEEAGG
jgi:hypothetical protein